MVFANPIRTSFAARVDCLIFMALAIPVWVSVRVESDPRPDLLLGSVSLALLIYMTICLSRWGRTLGMRFTGIQLMYADSSLVGYRKVLLLNSTFGILFMLPVILLKAVPSESRDLSFLSLIFFVYLFEMWKWVPNFLKQLGSGRDQRQIVVVVTRPQVGI